MRISVYSFLGFVAVKLIVLLFFFNGWHGNYWGLLKVDKDRVNHTFDFMAYKMTGSNKD